MPQETITLYKCARCGEKTEWSPTVGSYQLGNNPLCKSCWDKSPETVGMSGWEKRKRRKEIARLFTREGKSIEELALRFGVSQRTVQRALEIKLPEVKV